MSRPVVLRVAGEMARILISPGAKGGGGGRLPNCLQLCKTAASTPTRFICVPSTVRLADIPTDWKTENELLESISLEYPTFFFYHISATG
ncbi:rCG63340 [Rattus norvegicus]|uniref:RCG63340 n=1 Tax=Rattus norvegicus TaxID=10116 RepID=A6J788_RAT|nr:rCG63340 [Rattus norvegicus]